MAQGILSLLAPARFRPENRQRLVHLAALGLDDVEQFLRHARVHVALGARIDRLQVIHRVLNRFRPHGRFHILSMRLGPVHFEVVLDRARHIVDMVAQEHFVVRHVFHVRVHPSHILCTNHRQLRIDCFPYDLIDFIPKTLHI